MVQRLNPHIERALIAACFVALATGCASEPQTTYPRTPAPPPPQTQPRSTQPTPYPTQPTPQPTPAPTLPERAPPKPQSAVTLALQDEAQRAATAGDLPKAIQIIERAIRIEPDSAQLWIELARLHLKDGNPAQAEQFARKALLFTGGRYDLEQQAYVVISDARAAKR